MQPPADNAPSSSFAGILAALAAPAHKRVPAWDDQLADDVTTLSYERALSAHARYRSADRNDCALTQLPDPEPPRSASSSARPQASPLSTKPSPQAASPARAGLEPAAVAAPVSAQKQRKCASITIRLSSTECDQLHQRATEAGMTVSAYLRSCTLEAETLRALVKDTLAQLRAGSPCTTQSAGGQTSNPKPRFSWLAWLLRLLPRVRFGQRAVRA
jgi:Mobilization protein NikA